jgi:hypothetical protein
MTFSFLTLDILNQTHYQAFSVALLVKFIGEILSFECTYIYNTFFYTKILRRFLHNSEEGICFATVPYRDG